jgi:hypothetical protein
MMRARRGFSLVIVLVITTSLLFVAVAFTDALLQAARAARLGWQGERATHDADASLLEALAAWNPASAAALRPGEADTLPVAAPPLMTRDVVRARLSARMFLLESSVTLRDGGLRASRRSIGRAVRLDWPHVPAHGALTVAGHVEVGENSAVLGADAVPGGWSDECAADTRATPVVALTARSVTTHVAATVSGDGAPVRLLNDSTRALLAAEIDLAITQFEAVASTTSPDSVLSTSMLAVGVPACPQWFGDARRGGLPIPACTRRWPVVVATHPGTVRLTGDTPAQGVLVVRGDLHIDPGVEFNGLILIDGRLRIIVATGEPPVSLAGAVLVRDRVAAGSLLSGVAVVQASACAGRFALAAAGTPRPVQQHGWSERP